MDFAQNFGLTSQHEVQSAHFDKLQATVFTAFVVMGSEHKNFVIISNYLDHVRFDLHCLLNVNKEKHYTRILNSCISLNNFSLQE